MADFKHIGKDFIPHDVVAKVTGAAKYAEDFRADGMVFCRLLTSPMPHARVKNVDAAEALKMEGVLGMLRAADIPGGPPGFAPSLTDEPMYVGEPILAVAAVSEQAKKRQRDEMGTLGSGNHYLEVQEVTEVFDAKIAAAYGLAQGDIVVMIHCGSRGLGHQIGSEYLKRMAVSAAQHGIHLPDRELACAPITSDVGQEYLGAMRAAINCALANRHILTHLVRDVFRRMLPEARLPLLYDVSHNT